ncbi:MAG: hypothetical protein ACT6U0_20100, partial [Shinella sp.]
MHSTQFEPEELNSVKLIYDDIVAQGWFDTSEDARSSFARYLIDTYSMGHVEPTRFRKIVEFSARAYY